MQTLLILFLGFALVFSGKIPPYIYIFWNRFISRHFLHLRLYVGIIFDFALLTNFVFLIVRIEINVFVTKVIYAYGR